MTNAGGKITDLTWENLYNRYHILVNECPELKCFYVDRLTYGTVAQYGWEQQDEHDSIDFKKLHPNNYKVVFRILLKCEYAYMQMELCRYDTYGQQVSQMESKGFGLHNCITMVGIDKKEPALIRGDILIASSPPYESGSLNMQRQHLICFILATNKDSILFTLARRDRDGWFINTGKTIPEGLYDIRLTIPDSWLRQMLGGVFNLRNHLRMNLFDERLGGATPLLAPTKIIDIESVDQRRKFASLNKRLAKLDDKQRVAIEKILAGQYRPKPYILFGPPGTGKTRVLVEAIVQAYWRKPGAHILITASANTCVDRLIEELKQTKQLKDTDIVRLCSNAYYKTLKEPPAYFVDDPLDASCRIVVTTDSKATSLKSREFDYVFVDEAGHAMEPELLCSMNRCKEDGCIILAGDKHQLGPVVKFSRAKMIDNKDANKSPAKQRRSRNYHTLDESLLERLQKQKTYTLKDGISEKPQYDSDYIIQLTNCYRCDPRLLKVPNDLAYQAMKLDGLNETPKDLLNKMGTENPNLFFDVAGPESRHPSSFSTHNLYQSEVCIELVMKLYGFGYNHNQIGIITPYKAQKFQIIQDLRKKLKEECLSRNKKASKSAKRRYIKGKMCKIDTSDGFQGDEREFIIISLVRSPAEHDRKLALNFIDDMKRFIVTLTRAKWMNILVGDFEVLRESPKWISQIKISQRRVDYLKPRDS